MNNSSTISLPRPLSPAEAKIVWRTTDKRTGFADFIFKEKANRLYLSLALAAIVAQFLVFKVLYPFPDFFSDSYSYIYAAYAHLDVSIWPIGYSKFLAAFHGLTHSDMALVGFQYFFLELSALYFFFTWSYFFRPGRNSRIVLFCFLLFNPLFLYISNYVNSDPLFAALSLWWFTELIWIINRPRLYQVFTQGVLLFLCFTVRNNAYIYPFIAIVAFLLSQERPWVKLVGCLLGPALILPFVLHTRAVAKQMTGTLQFSLFTGWQLANNALYFADKIPQAKFTLPDQQANNVNLLARQFMTKFSSAPEYRDYLVNFPGNFFIKESAGPLKVYFSLSNKIKNNYDYTAAWGRSSAVFQRYGKFLIERYPFLYIRYFVVPNAQHYFLPQLEKLETYNLGKDTLGPLARVWFDLPVPEVRSVSKTAQGTILYLYPALFLTLNALFIYGLFYIRRRPKHAVLPVPVTKTILMLSAFQLLNLIFCLNATIIVFRYQVFPMLLLVAGNLLLFDEAFRNLKIEKQNTSYAQTI